MTFDFVKYFVNENFLPLLFLFLLQGCGFGFNYSLQSWDHITGISDHGLQRVNLQPPCPSAVFQRVLAKLCIEDKDLSCGFLNGVLNQLNWAFSEFIGMLQQVSLLSQGYYPEWKMF